MAYLQSHQVLLIVGVVADLTRDLAHIHADECCNLVWPGTLPALAIVFLSGSCSLAGEFLKYPYQVHFQL